MGRNLSIFLFSRRFSHLYPMHARSASTGLRFFSVQTLATFWLLLLITIHDNLRICTGFYKKKKKKTKNHTHKQNKTNPILFCALIAIWIQRTLLNIELKTLWSWGSLWLHSCFLLPNPHISCTQSTLETLATGCLLSLVLFLPWMLSVSGLKYKRCC